MQRIETASADYSHLTLKQKRHWYRCRKQQCNLLQQKRDFCLNYNECDHLPTQLQSNSAFIDINDVDEYIHQLYLINNDEIDFSYKLSKGNKKLKTNYMMLCSHCHLNLLPYLHSILKRIRDCIASYYDQCILEQNTYGYLRNRYVYYHLAFLFDVTHQPRIMHFICSNEDCHKPDLDFYIYALHLKYQSRYAITPDDQIYGGLFPLFNKLEKYFGVINIFFTGEHTKYLFADHFICNNTNKIDFNHRDNLSLDTFIFDKVFKFSMNMYRTGRASRIMLTQNKNIGRFEVTAFICSFLSSFLLFDQTFMLNIVRLTYFKHCLSFKQIGVEIDVERIDKQFNQALLKNLYTIGLVDQSGLYLQKMPTSFDSKRCGESIFNNFIIDKSYLDELEKLICQNLLSATYYDNPLKASTNILNWHNRGVAQCAFWQLSVMDEYLCQIKCFA